MKRKLDIAALAVIGLFVLLSTGCFKVIKIGEEAKVTGVQEFSATENIAEIWDSKAKPELMGKAIGFAELYEKTGGNFSDGGQYGKYSMGTSGELSFVVSGEATVMEVHDEKKAGYLLVEMDGVETEKPVLIQIGDLFKGTSVRDSLDLISYDDYKNQVEWAAVSQSINKKILETVIAPLDLPSLQGRKISFVGCFTANESNEILITPIELSER